MFDEKHIKEAGNYSHLGPAYFEAEELVSKLMAKFETEQFKPLVDKFAAAFREKLWTELEDCLLSDAEANVQGHIYRMVDSSMQAILSGERWAIERYALGRYDGRKARAAIAQHIPAELQDARIADLEEENKRLKESLEFYRR